MSGILNRIFSPWRIRKLRREYIALHGLSRSDVENALARQLTLLKRKRPGQNEEGHLKKIIYDPEMDRSR